MEVTAGATSTPFPWESLCLCARKRKDKIATAPVPAAASAASAAAALTSHPVISLCSPFTTSPPETDDDAKTFGQNGCRGQPQAAPYKR